MEHLPQEAVSWCSMFLVETAEGGQVRHRHDVWIKGNTRDGEQVRRQQEETSRPIRNAEHPLREPACALPRVPLTAKTQAMQLEDGARFSSSNQAKGT